MHFIQALTPDSVEIGFLAFGILMFVGFSTYAFFTLRKINKRHADASKRCEEAWAAIDEADAAILAEYE